MFKESSIEIVNRRHEELTGEEILSTVAMSFDIHDVIAFRETIEDGEEDISSNKSIIYLRSGENFIIDIPYKQLKQLII